MQAADRAILDADDWFASLPVDRRDRLLNVARSRTVASGTLAYALGDPPNGLWAVVQGQVRLIGYPAPGLEFLALILRPGTWFGEVSTIDGGPRPHEAVAFGETRLLHVPTPAFHRLAAEVPALYHDLGRLVCQHQRVALDFIGQTVALPLGVRIARLLLSRADDDGGVLHLRQEDIAGMLSVSRQTLNRHLGTLADAGMIERAYARIRICDPVRLGVLAGEG